MKQLRWKQILPNTDRGWLLRRGDVVLGKVTPQRNKLTGRVTEWVWFAGLTGVADVQGRAGDPSDAKRECLAWIKQVEQSAREVERRDATADFVPPDAAAQADPASIPAQFRSQPVPAGEIMSIDKDSASPWPLRDVLRKLIEATRILMDDYNYDGHGWEILHIAALAGVEYVEGRVPGYDLNTNRQIPVLSEAEERVVGR